MFMCASDYIKNDNYYIGLGSDTNLSIICNECTNYTVDYHERYIYQKLVDNQYKYKYKIKKILNYFTKSVWN